MLKEPCELSDGRASSAESGNGNSRHQPLVFRKPANTHGKRDDVGKSHPHCCKYPDPEYGETEVDVPQ
jgi:hypothetical protein